MLHQNAKLDNYVEVSIDKKLRCMFTKECNVNILDDG